MPHASPLRSSTASASRDRAAAVRRPAPSRSRFPLATPALALPALLTLSASGVATAGITAVDIDQPVIDQWVYPFNMDIAGSFFASVFSSQLPEGFTDLFDNRDGQAAVAFDVSGVVPEGAEEYTIVSATLTMRTSTDMTFGYDPTPDSYTSWLQPDDPAFVPDADPGRALEVFGAGFRGGLTAETYTEETPYSFVGPFGQGVRLVHPIAFNSPAADLDASNNVSLQFDPTPFGVGLIEGMSPGDLVPVNTDVTFSLDVANEDVNAYLRDALEGGTLVLVVASLFPAEQQGSGTFPSFYTKEHPSVVAGVQEGARLSLVLDFAGGLVGDLDGNGVVDGADLGMLLSQWGGEGPADLDGSGAVDGGDLGILLANWS